MPPPRARSAALRCARSPSLARLLASLGAWLEGAAAWALSPWLEVQPLSAELSLGCGVGLVREWASASGKVWSCNHAGKRRITVDGTSTDPKTTNVRSSSKQSRSKATAIAVPHLLRPIVAYERLNLRTLMREVSFGIIRNPLQAQERAHVAIDNIRPDKSEVQERLHSPYKS